LDGLATVFFFNCVVVAIAVLVHYEALYRLAIFLPRLRIQPRFRVLVGVSGVFLAHVTEIWVFTFAYYLLLTWGSYGSLEGNFDGSLLDCGYFHLATTRRWVMETLSPLATFVFSQDSRR